MKKAQLCCALMAVFAWAAGGRAATVTLTNADWIGTSSFQAAGNWSSGFAPVAGNDYVVAVEYLRTPTSDGETYVFGGDSLVITNGGGLIVKSDDSTHVIDDLILTDGGKIYGGNSGGNAGTVFDGQLISSGSGGFIYANQSSYIINSDMSGNGDLTLAGNYALTLNGTIHLSADVIVSAGTKTFSADNRFVFSIGADGVNNAVSGGGTAVFNGTFVFDLSAAGTNAADSWLIADVNSQTFGATFAVSNAAGAAGTDSGVGFWYLTEGDTEYEFDESTGILSVIDDADKLHFGDVSPMNGAIVPAVQPVLSAEILDPKGLLDPDSIVMTFDGTTVAHSLVQSGVTSTVRHVVSTPLASDIGHTVRVTAAGTTGHSYTNEWSFSTATEVVLNAADVEEAMRRANDYFLANNSIGNEGWERGTYQTGNFRAWEVLGIPAYYDRAVAWGDANGWDHGTDYGDTYGTSADAHCCGQTYIDLFYVDPDPVRTNVITDLLSDLLLGNQPDSYNDWSWIDAFYMASSVLSRLYVLTDNTDWLDQLDSMYDDMKDTRGLFDAGRGLWWRDGDYVDTDTFWGRGNGWVIASLARNLEVLPADDTVCRPEFESMLKIMADALLPWQQADGFWRSDIINPDNYPNPETSGTAFFTYAIAYGINEGILIDSPQTNYSAAVRRAWDGMVNIALHEDGLLGYTQAVGSYPLGATYYSERDYGCGAFLLAGCEILRMLGGLVPVAAQAGGDLLLTDSDEDYVEPVALSASRSVVRSGSVTGYSWWSNSVKLGSGETLNVDFPLGINTVTLRVEHSDGNTYTDDLTVEVVSAGGVEVSATGYQSGNPPENTLDGDLDTRWSVEGDDGSHYLLYALAEPVTLDEISIAFYSGDSRRSRFAIWLSADGEHFTQVLPDPNGGGFPWELDRVESSGTTLELETFTFTPQSAAYVRINGWGNENNAWNSYTEVEIPGIPETEMDDQTDRDGNGIPDAWEIHYFGSTGQVVSVEIGDTGIALGDAYVLGLDPLRPDDAPMVKTGGTSNVFSLSVQTVGAFGVGYQGLTRKYSIATKDSLTNRVWEPLPGYEDCTGDSQTLEFRVTNPLSAQFFRTQIWLE